MGLVGLLLLIIFIASSLILILIVLIQDDQGEGIAGMFGGGSTTPFGSRSGNVLTKFTSIVGAIFIFGAISLAWINRTPEASDVINKARIERLKDAEEKNWWVEKIDKNYETDSPAVESSEEVKEENGQDTD